MSMDDTAHDAVYDDDEATESVAIIGMALRVPGAHDVEGFWDNLRRGVESVRFLSDDELRAEGKSEREMAGSHYVPAAAVLDGHDRFDAPFFDFSLREGSILDPQDRHFLECSYEALERAGYDPARTEASIGVFGGEGMNGYLFFNLQSNPQIVDTFGWLQLRFSNDKDFLTTLVSYKLDLKGPSVNVQTACSTSLVAVHLARESLLAGQCDIALAGGVTINVPQNVGYRWEDGSIASPDGHCRVFDAQGSGTVPASGVGVVVLKRLDEAIEDGDHIHAVLRGSALNNDGNLKVGYTAPSVEGQAEVIATALGIADLDARGIGYVEAHGTATKMGDPIEIAALTRAYREHTADTSFCAIGSVKSNFGHLDAAAGVAGLITATLAVERGEIPPSLHYEAPNPEIDFAASPFYVADRLIPWPGAAEGAEPRRAGISSFGIGGTNAHAVVEEPPPAAAGSASRSRQLILLSAKSRSALDDATRRLADHLDEHPDAELADVAYTLATGRRQMLHRRALVADHCEGGLADAIAGLRDDQRLPTAMAADTPPPVVFLFPGQGAQFPGMTRRLADEEPSFRAALDRCADGLRAHGIDLDALLFPADPTSDDAAALLRSTANTQPALFAVEWALAELWKSWGIEPQALLGHSIGELVAATLAGSLDLDDALALVATRGRLMQAMEPGAMLAVPRDEATVRGWLADAPEVELAVINAPDLCVVGGPAAAIDAFAARLDAEGVDGRRLHVSHAFHTAMMEPALAELRQVCARLRLAEPEIPWVSNVTGTWITREQATDPGYWAEHVRSTVRFADGLATLLDDPDRVFLEVGPGHVLSDQVRRQRPTGSSRPVPVTIPSLPGPRDEDDDLDVLYAAVGRLWQTGAEVDFAAFYEDQQRCRVPLPTYPFEHRRLWIDPLPTDTRPVEAAAVGSWLSTPLWEQSRPARTAPTASPERWLLLVDEGGLGAMLAQALRATGAT
ncbi:MAG: type I polyketide synthase, partial [Acidobacteriota bacterium]